MVPKFVDNAAPIAREFTRDDINNSLGLLNGLETGYDDAAIKSYRLFAKLKSEGHINQGVKFQVSLPTVANVVGVLIEEGFRKEVEPIYEAALFRALDRIQAEIPHTELAIQIDLGMDLAYWEGVLFKPWFDNKEHVVDYVAKMIQKVHVNVDVGIHYCYGDMDHKHFIEPKSLQSIVDLHQQILKRKTRQLDWMHCPVPISAVDQLDAYLSPLSALLPLSHTRLYLGLIHPRRPEETRKMFEAAKKVVDDFGVGTECGLGRTPKGDVKSIMDISMELCTQ
ncbi:hypothetical protein AK830_g4118 [Neonectria ditissima]|uniref:Cobalamin-independent methionine synthase MetE C-terminal/archaeal domain-containing protein n=1 Tax=Neonectria ditissima TaxID=78410 RepID=A0A0P7B7D8_9HYPO|nr:hypothetical protein AK830_g4118 [Neonectria ditissima]